MDSDSDMIVKRVSVPMGLEELMEGLSKEVLLKKPKDLCEFAAEYFSRLLELRHKGSYKGNKIKIFKQTLTVIVIGTSFRNITSGSKHISKEKIEEFMRINIKESERVNKKRTVRESSTEPIGYKRTQPGKTVINIETTTRISRKDTTTKDVKRRSTVSTETRSEHRKHSTSRSSNSNSNSSRRETLNEKGKKISPRESSESKRSSSKESSRSRKNYSERYSRTSNASKERLSSEKSSSSERLLGKKGGAAVAVAEGVAITKAKKSKSENKETIDNQINENIVASSNIQENSATSNQKIKEKTQKIRNSPDIKDNTLDDSFSDHFSDATPNLEDLLLDDKTVTSTENSFDNVEKSKHSLEIIETISENVQNEETVHSKISEEEIIVDSNKRTIIERVNLKKEFNTAEGTNVDELQLKNEDKRTKEKQELKTETKNTMNGAKVDSKIPITETKTTEKDQKMDRDKKENANNDGLNQIETPDKTVKVKTLQKGKQVVEDDEDDKGASESDENFQKDFKISTDDKEKSNQNDIEAKTEEVFEERIIIEETNAGKRLDNNKIEHPIEFKEIPDTDNELTKEKNNTDNAKLETLINKEETHGQILENKDNINNVNLKEEVKYVEEQNLNTSNKDSISNKSNASNNKNISTNSIDNENIVDVAKNQETNKIEENTDDVNKKYENIPSDEIKESTLNKEEQFEITEIAAVAKEELNVINHLHETQNDNQADNSLNLEPKIEVIDGKIIKQIVSNTEPELTNIDVKEINNKEEEIKDSNKKEACEIIDAKENKINEEKREVSEGPDMNNSTDPKITKSAENDLPEAIITKENTSFLKNIVNKIEKTFQSKSRTKEGADNKYDTKGDTNIKDSEENNVNKDVIIPSTKSFDVNELGKETDGASKIENENARNALKSTEKFEDNKGDISVIKNHDSALFIQNEQSHVFRNDNSHSITQDHTLQSNESTSKSDRVLQEKATPINAEIANSIKSFEINQLTNKFDGESKTEDEKDVSRDVLRSPKSIVNKIKKTLSKSSIQQQTDSNIDDTKKDEIKIVKDSEENSNKDNIIPSNKSFDGNDLNKGIDETSIKGKGSRDVLKSPDSEENSYKDNKVDILKYPVQKLEKLITNSGEAAIDTVDKNDTNKKNVSNNENNEIEVKSKPDNENIVQENLEKSTMDDSESIHDDFSNSAKQEELALIEKDLITFTSGRKKREIDLSQEREDLSQETKDNLEPTETKTKDSKKAYTGKTSPDIKQNEESESKKVCKSKEVQNLDEEIDGKDESSKAIQGKGNLEETKQSETRNSKTHVDTGETTNLIESKDTKLEKQNINEETNNPNDSKQITEKIEEKLKDDLEGNKKSPDSIDAEDTKHTSSSTDSPEKAKKKLVQQDSQKKVSFDTNPVRIIETSDNNIEDTITFGDSNSIIKVLDKNIDHVEEEIDKLLNSAKGVDEKSTLVKGDPIKEEVDELLSSTESVGLKRCKSVINKLDEINKPEKTLSLDENSVKTKSFDLKDLRKEINNAAGDNKTAKEDEKYDKEIGGNVENEEKPIVVKKEDISSFIDNERSDVFKDGQFIKLNLNDENSSVLKEDLQVMDTIEKELEKEIISNEDNSSINKEDNNMDNEIEKELKTKTDLGEENSSKQQNEEPKKEIENNNEDKRKIKEQTNKEFDKEMQNVDQIKENVSKEHGEELKVKIKSEDNHVDNMQVEETNKEGLEKDITGNKVKEEIEHSITKEDTINDNILGDQMPTKSKENVKNNITEETVTKELEKPADPMDNIEKEDNCVDKTLVKETIEEHEKEVQNLDRIEETSSKIHSEEIKHEIEQKYNNVVKTNVEENTKKEELRKEKDIVEQKVNEENIEDTINSKILDNQTPKKSNTGLEEYDKTNKIKDVVAKELEKDKKSEDHGEESSPKQQEEDSKRISEVNIMNNKEETDHLENEEKPIIVNKEDINSFIDNEKSDIFRDGNFIKLNLNEEINIDNVGNSSLKNQNMQGGEPKNMDITVKEIKTDCIEENNAKNKINEDKNVEKTKEDKNNSEILGNEMETKLETENNTTDKTDKNSPKTNNTIRNEESPKTTKNVNTKKQSKIPETDVKKLSKNKSLNKPYIKNKSLSQDNIKVNEAPNKTTNSKLKRNKSVDVVKNSRIPEHKSRIPTPNKANPNINNKGNGKDTSPRLKMGIVDLNKNLMDSDHLKKSPRVLSGKKSLQLTDEAKEESKEEDSVKENKGLENKKEISTEDKNNFKDDDEQKKQEYKENIKEGSEESKKNTGRKIVHEVLQEKKESIIEKNINSDNEVRKENVSREEEEETVKDVNEESTTEKNKKLNQITGKENDLKIVDCDVSSLEKENAENDLEIQNTANKIEDPELGEKGQNKKTIEIISAKNNAKNQEVSSKSQNNEDGKDTKNEIKHKEEFNVNEKEEKQEKNKISKEITEEEKQSRFDSSKLSNELKQIHEDAKLSSFKTSYNPYALRQEIKKASQEKSDNSVEIKNGLIDVAAALKIQKNWRKFKNKSKKNKEALKEKNVLTISEVMAAIKIQNSWRKYKNKAINKDNKTVKNNKIKISDVMAALKIQNSWKKYKLKKSKNNDDFYKSALLIQKLWRGFKVRKVQSEGKLFGLLKDDDKIKKIEELKSPTEHLKTNSHHSAASKIQALWRGFKVRENILGVQNKLQLMENNENSNKNKTLSESDIMKAATKIQANTRGYLQRKKLKEHTNTLMAIDEDTNKESANTLTDDEILHTLKQLDKIEIPKDDLTNGRTRLTRSITVDEPEHKKRIYGLLTNSHSLNIDEGVVVDEEDNDLMDSNNNFDEKSDLTPLESEVKQEIDRICKTAEVRENVDDSKINTDNINKIKDHSDVDNRACKPLLTTENKNKQSNTIEHDSNSNKHSNKSSDKLYAGKASGDDLNTDYENAPTRPLTSERDNENKQANGKHMKSKDGSEISNDDIKQNVHKTDTVEELEERPISIDSTDSADTVILNENYNKDNENQSKGNKEESANTENKKSKVNLFDIAQLRHELEEAGLIHHKHFTSFEDVDSNIDKNSDNNVESHYDVTLPKDVKDVIDEETKLYKSRSSESLAPILEEQDSINEDAKTKFINEGVQVDSPNEIRLVHTGEFHDTVVIPLSPRSSKSSSKTPDVDEKVGGNVGEAKSQVDSSMQTTPPRTQAHLSGEESVPPGQVFVIIADWFS
ncbi:unnamed protein product [Brassicogethes aeneus]|uniref:RIIa domain-containing protein n=1 Tax=Brassicogethes aeneus TaxID=1431903 RepID=A0A9P0FFJ8_BRAAE|nr:unnamed protein product [Brassicogethes aeneus]